MATEWSARLAQHSAALQQKRAEENDDKTQGLLEFLNPVNLIKGIAGMGAEAASTVKGIAQAPGTAINTLRLALDDNVTDGEQFLREQEQGPLGFLTNTDAIRAAAQDQPSADAIQGAWSKQFPLLTTLSESFAQTGINLADPIARGVSQTGLTPSGKLEWSENPYARAWGEKRLAPVLMNDALNLSLVGAPAAKGLTRAGAPGAAAKVEAAAQAAPRVPFAPYTVPARALKSGVGRVMEGGTLADTRLGSLLTRSETGAGLVNAADEAAHFVGSGVERGKVRAGLANRSAALVGPITHEGPAVKRLAKEVPLAEQEAAHLVRASIPEETLATAQRIIDAPLTEAELAAATERLGAAAVPAEIEAAVRQGRLNQTRLGTMVADPEALTVARSYYAGDPAAKASIDRVLSTMEPARAASEGLYLEGKGLKQGLSPEQRRGLAYSDEPLEFGVERGLHEAKPEAMAELADIDKALGSLSDDVDRTALMDRKAAIEEELAPIRRELELAPDNAPANYRPALKVGEATRTSAEQMAEKLRADGLDAYADELLAAAEGVITNLDQATSILDSGGASIGEAPRHIVGGKTGEATATKRQILAQKKVGSEYMKAGTSADLSATGQYNAMVSRAHDQATNIAIGEFIEQYGRPEPGAIGRWSKVSEAGVKVGDDAAGMWVPDFAAKAIHDMTRPATKNAFLKGYDKGLATLKLSWLPLSPKWQVGNIAGNALMGWLGSGVTPVDWITKGGEAIKAMRNPDANVSAVMRKGMSEELITESGLKQGGLLQRATDKAFAANQWIDDFGHVLSYLKEHEAALKKGMSEGQAAEEAVRRSLHVMGNFKNLATWEKEGMRRAMPFYPWYKHITKLAFSLPLESPARLAWTMHLADEFDPAKGAVLPDFLKGSIPLDHKADGSVDTQGRFLRLPWNPFPGGTSDSPLTNPASALGALTPAVQWPLAAAGFNAGMGRMMTTAPTERDPDKMGFIGWKPLAGYMVDQFPQSRLLADLNDKREGKEILRYDTREPWLIKGKPVDLSQQDLGPIPAPLLQFATGIQVDQPDVAKQLKRSDKERKQREKAARKYEKRLERLD